MNPPGSSVPEDDVERLLSLLAGVISAEAVRDAAGIIREIHVLATTEHQPKQVVRNVESALRAGLGIEIDRRIVSVAQVAGTGNGASPARTVPPSTQRVAPPKASHPVKKATSPDASATPLPPAAPEPPRPAAPRARTESAPSATPRPAAAPVRKRIVLTSFDSSRLSPLQSSCHVRLVCDGRGIEGSGTGATNLVGRANAGARAVFAALEQIPEWNHAGFDGAAVVDAHGHTYVVVAASLRGVREPVTLAGASFLGSSPERAGIFASLQATNRISRRARAAHERPSAS